MESKRKLRKKMKIMLEKLKEKAVINPNARCNGKPQLSNSPASKKDRKRKGRVTPKLNKGTPVKYLIEEGIEPAVEWDDWNDYRDGQRAWHKDRSLKKDARLIKKLKGSFDCAETMERDQIKIKKHEDIRRIRKLKQKDL